MATTRCTNPIVLEVGVEEASADAVAGLASMIDPEAGACWREDRLNTVVDLGEVTWLIQAEQASRLPASLRLLVSQVGFERPPIGNQTVFALSVLLETAGDLSIDLADPLYGWRRVSALLGGQFRHGKRLYATMIDALSTLQREAADGERRHPF